MEQHHTTPTSRTYGIRLEGSRVIARTFRYRGSAIGEAAETARAQHRTWEIIKLRSGAVEARVDHRGLA